MNIDEAQALINAHGNAEELRTIDFDVNKIIITNRPDSTWSDNHENNYDYITEKTLLHVAIQTANLNAINVLLELGADRNIDYKETVEREQRSLISGNAYSMFGGGEWTNWEKWSPRVRKQTCIELAGDNVAILNLMNPNPGLVV